MHNVQFSPAFLAQARNCQISAAQLERIEERVTTWPEDGALYHEQEGYALRVLPWGQYDIIYTVHKVSGDISVVALKPAGPIPPLDRKSESWLRSLAKKLMLAGLVDELKDLIRRFSDIDFDLSWNGDEPAKSIATAPEDLESAVEVSLIGPRELVSVTSLNGTGVTAAAVSEVGRQRWDGVVSLGGLGTAATTADSQGGLARGGSIVSLAERLFGEADVPNPYSADITDRSESRDIIRRDSTWSEELSLKVEFVSKGIVVIKLDMIQTEGSDAARARVAQLLYLAYFGRPEDSFDLISTTNAVLTSMRSKGSNQIFFCSTSRNSINSVVHDQSFNLLRGGLNVPQGCRQILLGSIPKISSNRVARNRSLNSLGVFLNDHSDLRKSNINKISPFHGLA